MTIYLLAAALTAVGIFWYNREEIKESLSSEYNDDVEQFFIGGFVIPFFIIGAAFIWPLTLTVFGAFLIFKKVKYRR